MPVCVCVCKDLYMCIFVGAYTLRCMPLLLMHACLDSKKFAGIALMLPTPPPKKRKTPHTQNQTVQKPHHRRLQCPPQLPRCTSPKEIHLANTCRHKHTRGHITTGLLPCLPTSIYTLGPTGTVVVHSAYYRGCMQFKHSTLRVKLIRHTHTCRQTR